MKTAALGTAALGIAMALTLAACTERDYGDLPKDPKERAQACLRASILHVGTRTEAGDKAGTEAATAKMRELMEAIDFARHFPDAKSDPAKAFGTNEEIANAAQADWLTTLNRCFAAYEIALEPEPSLPAAPYEQALTCAAATSLDNSRGKAINPNSRTVSDPEGYYFVHKAAKLKGGADGVVAASDAAIEALKQLLGTGAGHLLAKRCRETDPKAVKGSAAALPADPLTAGAVCSPLLGQLKQGGLAVGAGDTELGGRYAAAEAKWDAELNTIAASDAQIAAAQGAALDYVVASGRSDAVAGLCVKK
ncbi:hypothetical protein [Sphingomonas soli]|uniref:hypothetical protein n=1 Tax=Sphingomonas soli TaxID=266127 RepID=UPI00082C22FB|nr:hypothetical protein [Sphingomonas soli]